MRRFTALLNPISGAGNSSSSQVWAPVQHRLEQAGGGVEVVQTRSAAHAVEAARRAAAAGDVVVAVGGDGLVRDAAAGVAGTEALFGIVPAGRGNDFARGCGFPGDADGMAHLLLDAEPVAIDTIDVDGETALGNVYFGLDSHATSVVNRLRRLPAALVYRIAPPLAMLTWRAAEARIVVDGQVRELAVDSVVVANSGWYGHGLNIVPGAHVDDGLLDVMIVATGPKRDVVAVTREARTGAHVHRSRIEILRGAQVEVSTTQPVRLCADGDDISALPAVIQARPGALRALLPTDSRALRRTSN